MFAYCGNSPILRCDNNGLFWTELWEGIKEVIRSILHGANNVAVEAGIDTAAMGAAMLDMYESDPGVYHASTDCWQQYFGYNSIYDFVFDAGTSMCASSFEFTSETGDITYIIWVWKGDYINLGAGAEMGIYYGGGPHWLVDTSLSMNMTMSLSYNGAEIINHSQNTWWITGFNSNYLNVQASALAVTYTIYFNDPRLYNQFSQTWNGKSGWVCNPANYSATLVF